MRSDGHICKFINTHTHTPFYRKHRYSLDPHANPALAIPKAAKPGGKLVLVGMGSAIQTLPIAAAALREVDIVGVFRYAHTYPVALELLGTGKLPRVHELITHRRSLLHADEAFVLARNGKDEAGTPVIKVLIENHVDSSRL